MNGRLCDSRLSMGYGKQETQITMIKQREFQTPSSLTTQGSVRVIMPPFKHERGSLSIGAV